MCVLIFCSVCAVLSQTVCVCVLLFSCSFTAFVDRSFKLCVCECACVRVPLFRSVRAPACLCACVLTLASSCDPLGLQVQKGVLLGSVPGPSVRTLLGPDPHPWAVCQSCAGSRPSSLGRVSEPCWVQTLIPGPCVRAVLGPDPLPSAVRLSRAGSRT